MRPMQSGENPIFPLCISRFSEVNKCPAALSRRAFVTLNVENLRSYFMSEKKIKKCPFSQGECTNECSLFIDAQDLNELLAARLSSLGVLDRENGMCSLKSVAMSAARYIFENTSTKRF